jgi:hypothetical protein
MFTRIHGPEGFFVNAPIWETVFFIEVVFDSGVQRKAVPVIFYNQVLVSADVNGIEIGFNSAG